MVRTFEVLFVLLLASEAQMDDFLSATVGDNITLPCHDSSNLQNARLYWYKQSLGLKPKLVSAFFKYLKVRTLYGEFNSSKRFILGHEENYLQMNHVQVSDSAVYICLLIMYHEIKVLESFTVIVKSLNPGAEVQQSPHEDTEEGGSVILKCSVHTGSCGGQHTVHWFKQSEESAPGVLYSHGGGDSDQCGRNTDSPTNSCVYSLPIHNVSSEQTGSYYCAVAACGQVLFGDGTRVEIKDGRGYIIYVLSGAWVFFTALIVALASSLCRMKKKYHSLSTEFKCQYGSSAVNDGAVSPSPKLLLYESVSEIVSHASVSQSQGSDGYRTRHQSQDQDVGSLNYAALNIHPASRRQRNTETTDCVYSGVQQD